MKKIDVALKKTVAKKMIIDGEPWDKIIDETHLRCGDINIGMNDLAFDHADIIHDAIDKGL